MKLFGIVLVAWGNWDDSRCCKGWVWSRDGQVLLGGTTGRSVMVVFIRDHCGVQVW